MLTRIARRIVSLPGGRRLATLGIAAAVLGTALFGGMKAQTASAFWPGYVTYPSTYSYYSPYLGYSYYPYTYGYSYYGYSPYWYYSYPYSYGYPYSYSSYYWPYNSGYGYGYPYSYIIP